MDWLKQVIQKYPVHSLIFPTLLGFVTFLANLISALSDGVIDGNEFHQLMSSSSGIETVLLLVVMVALKKKK